MDNSRSSAKGTTGDGGVSQNERADKAFRESEEQLRILINAMPDIVAFKDGEGRWLEANEFDLKLFHLEQVDYRGKKDSELAEFSPFYRDAFLACELSDEIAWKAGKTSRADEVIPRPDGPPMVFDIIKVPVFREDGRRKGLVVVGRDVTERKLAEAKLNQYQERLESLVRERTAELAEANAQLRTEITERRSVEERLRESLEEKEILLKEVHHRVKNNLQIVSSLLELQAASIEDEQARKVFMDSQDRIRSMGLIHEKLYRTGNLSHMDFGEYLENLAGRLFNAYVSDPERVSLHIAAPNVSMGIDEAVPCGLIVNELMTNALKYAFQDGRKGEIRVGFDIDPDGRARLMVADNGVGLPVGLDPVNCETMGLQLVCILTRQLGGSIEVGAPGTRFVIRFRSAMKPRGAGGN